MILFKKDEAIASINTMHDWVLDARKGEEAVYFHGELSRARLIDHNNRSALNSSASYAFSLMADGFVTLVQRIGSPGPGTRARRFFYTMQRIGREMVKGRK